MSHRHKSIIKRHYRRLFRLNHVIGMGFGRKEKKGRPTKDMAIIFLVDEKVSARKLSRFDLLPQRLKDYPTDVIEVGQLNLQKRKSKIRPAQPGVSISHYLVSAGTLGAIVKDKRSKKTFILSNNHVLANQTTGFDGRARYGDPIIQPGSYDHGNKSNDIIGYLERFIPVIPNYQANSFFRFFRSTTRNKVDCAVARPVSEDVISNEIIGLGEVKGFVEPSPGMLIAKSGRTTGITRGSIKAIDGVVEVNMEGNKTAIFADQIITDPISQGGDSGSLVLDQNNHAVGLLFAGSNKASVCNKIANVLEALSIEF